MDALPQEEADLPRSVVQGEDMGIKVVFVTVAHEDQLGLALRQGRKGALPPVKEQGDGGELNEEAAVGKIGHAHGSFSFSGGDAG